MFGNELEGNFGLNLTLNATLIPGYIETFKRDIQIWSNIGCMVRYWSTLGINLVSHMVSVNPPWRIGL